MFRNVNILQCVPQLAFYTSSRMLMHVPNPQLNCIALSKNGFKKIRNKAFFFSSPSI